MDATGYGAAEEFRGEVNVLGAARKGDGLGVLLGKHWDLAFGPLLPPVKDLQNERKLRLFSILWRNRELEERNSQGMMRARRRPQGRGEGEILGSIGAPRKRSQRGDSA